MGETEPANSQSEDPTNDKAENVPPYSQLGDVVQEHPQSRHGGLNLPHSSTRNTRSKTARILLLREPGRLERMSSQRLPKPRTYGSQKTDGHPGLSDLNLRSRAQPPPESQPTLWRVSGDLQNPFTFSPGGSELAGDFPLSFPDQRNAEETFCEIGFDCSVTDYG